MKYTKFQQKYIDSVDVEAHNYAVRIIGELERYINAQKELMCFYKIGKQPTEKVFDAIDRGRRFGIE